MTRTSESVLRVANCSGFYGDRLSAAREMVEGGKIDFLTGDYLAELTMFILAKARQKDLRLGYAVTFLQQLEEVLDLCISRGVRIVVNAGGLNPAGLAEAVKALAAKLGVPARVAYITGDDILGCLAELQAAGHQLAHLDRGIPLSDLDVKPVSANVYLGAWGIVEALRQESDIVICPRVTDASLVVGPAAWHFGWQPDDWDRLASAVVAGHILECGPQATGGNYAFFQEVPDLAHAGFPIAEIEADGAFTVTKHQGTGGLVSVGTVTAQLLYEIEGPAYRNPDVIARFDSIHLTQVGPDRVRVSDVRGEPRPADLKVGINYSGGYRNTMTFVLTGMGIQEKARMARETLLENFTVDNRPEVVEFALIRSDRSDATTNDEASASLRATVKDRNPRAVGRGFSNKVTEMLLASYPGIYTTTPPGPEREFGVYWPALVPATVVRHTVVTADGNEVNVALPLGPGKADVTLSPPEIPEPPRGVTERLPLGTVFGARSGDKGGNANLGVWARSDLGYAWLADFLTEKRLQELLPELLAFGVQRFVLPNLRAVNFVIVGLLGDGVAASTRSDAQAKSLGEFLRSRLVDLPVALLADAPVQPKGEEEAGGIA